MIYYDVTRMGGKAPRSGLTRLSARLQCELAGAVVPVAWDGRRRAWRRSGGGAAVGFSPADWLLTVELFSPAERPGFRDFLAARSCRLAALFHDAIPLRFPHITWPQSVQRHAEYMKMLAGFDRCWAISRATREDFLGFWRWQGVVPRGPVDVLELGADFDGSARAAGAPAAGGRRSLLCVGIVEPRKNQGFLLDVAEALWRDGVDFDLHIVGRVNPHFGGPLAGRMRRLERSERRFCHHAAADDEALRRLYASARAVVFPTIAEGCGLPVLEALWRGVPCVCSDLPVLRENSAGGGCLGVAVNDAAAWTAALRQVLGDDACHARLQREAVTRPLPRWADTAAVVRAALSARAFSI